MTGTFGPGTSVALHGRQWLPRPADYIMVDLSGRIDPRSRHMNDTVIGPGCGTFELTGPVGPRRGDDACHEAGSVISALP